MATRRASTGTVPSLTSSFTLTLATHAAGDMLLAWVGGKYGATATIPAAPSGWALVASTTGGTITTGNDAGDSFLALYARVAVSSSETNPVFNAGGTAPDSWWGIAESFTPAAGKEWDDRFAFSSMPKATGNDTTATTPLTASGTFGTQPNAIRGDTIACCGAIPTDAGTGASSPTLTFASGATGGSAAVGTYVENALGADSAGISWDLVGFTGASTGTVTIAVTIAGATNNYGPVMAVWLRESVTKTGSDSAAGTDTTSTRYVGRGEVGTGAETGAVVVNKSGTDSGAGTDASTLAVTITRDDPAAATDTRALAVAFTRTDSGAGTERSSNRYTGAGELASATDAATVQTGPTPKSGSDDATADDSGDLTTAATPGGDDATATETSTRLRYGHGGDIAIGTEGANIDVTSGDIPKSGADTAAATETAQPGPQGADTAAASDIEDLTTVATPGGEVGTGTETTRVVYRGQGEIAYATDVGLVTTAPIQALDAATGTDASTLAVAITRDDPAAAAEARQVAAALFRAEEVGTATEDQLLAPTVIADEPAVATEAAQLLAQVAGADTATGTETAPNPGVVALGADTATGTEQALLDTGASKSAADDATGAELVTDLSAALARADTAAGAEQAQLATAVQAADGAVAAETGVVGSQAQTTNDGATAVEQAMLVVIAAAADIAFANDAVRKLKVHGPPHKGPGSTRGGGVTTTVGGTGPGRTRP